MQPEPRLEAPTRPIPSLPPSIFPILQKPFLRLSSPFSASAESHIGGPLLKKTYLLPPLILAALLTGCPSPTAVQPGKAAPSLNDYKIIPVGARNTAASNPYGSTVSTPLPLKQLYFDGASYSGADVNLVGYTGTSPKILHQETNASASGWSKSYPHASTAARLGSGNKESIVSVVFVPDAAIAASTTHVSGKIELVVWDGSVEKTYHPSFRNGGAFDLYRCNWGGTLYYDLNAKISAASGDLTGDGKDEIGFCVDNRFIILDGNLSTVLYDGWATSSDAADTDITQMHPSRVAAGDLKGDGSTEFVVTYGSSKIGSIAYYRIFGGSSPSIISSGTLAQGVCPYSLMYANVALGDIDGDGRKEVLFAGRKDLTGNDCVLVAAAWDASSSGLKFFQNGFAVGNSDGGLWGFHSIAPLVAFNPDEKTAVKRELVLVWNSIVAYDSSAKTFSLGYKGLSYISLPVYTNVAAADLNYDHQDELISMSSVGGAGIETWSLGTGNSFTKTTLSVPITGTDYYPSLCAADLEGNSLTLRFKSQTVKYSNPSIVAVLASPPYYADAASNPAMGNTGTTFGTKKDTSNTSSTSFSVSASMTFGAEAEAPLEGDALKLRTTATLGASFTYAFESERETSCGHYFTYITGKDAVIFSCVPFDVYTYEILSAPNSATAGRTMTVDFPRDPQLIMMDRLAFNALPNNPLQVGSSVLVHTLGQPKSYRNHDAVVQLCASDGDMYDDEGMTSPSDGNGIETSSVSSTNVNSKRVGTGASIVLSREAVVLGVVFGQELGFDTSFDYTVKTSTSTEISGSVPGINDSDSPFWFGIAGYKLTDTSVQPNPFLVVTYWVGK